MMPWKTGIGECSGYVSVAGAVCDLYFVTANEVAPEPSIDGGRWQRMKFASSLRSMGTARSVAVCEHPTPFSGVQIVSEDRIQPNKSILTAAPSLEIQMSALHG